jgi:hypothetical protein
MIYSLNGTFDVTEIIALAYDNNNGLGDSTRSFGVLHPVSEPGTLALLGVGCGFHARRPLIPAHAGPAFHAMPGRG